MIVDQEYDVHKNQGKTVDDLSVIILKHTDPNGVIQMKTKTKIGPVDTVIGIVPRDACASRIDNWRAMLKASEEGNPRRIRLWIDNDIIYLAELLVTKDDNIEWDSPPDNVPYPLWIPFYCRWSA